MGRRALLLDGDDEYRRLGDLAPGRAAAAPSPSSSSSSGAAVVFTSIGSLMNIATEPLFDKARTLLDRLFPPRLIDVTANGVYPIRKGAGARAIFGTPARALLLREESAAARAGRRRAPALVRRRLHRARARPRLRLRPSTLLRHGDDGAVWRRADLDAGGARLRVRPRAALGGDGRRAHLRHRVGARRAARAFKEPAAAAEARRRPDPRRSTRTATASTRSSGGGRHAHRARARRRGRTPSPS